MPTIFDWVQRFDFLRGMPAALVVAAAALCVVVIRDWRWSLLALMVQYLVAGLLFVDVLDPRLAIIKVFVGMFVCLIFYFTARQVNWGRLPVDVTAAEAVQLRNERQLRFGPHLLPTSAPFRVFLGLMMFLVVWAVSQQAIYRLPAVPAHVNLAVYTLVGMGLLSLGLTTDPLRAGMGLLTVFLGFELFYNALEQSLAILAFLAAANLVLAVVLARLTQARHALPGLFEHEV